MRYPVRFCVDQAINSERHDKAIASREIQKCDLRIEPLHRSLVTENFAFKAQFSGNSADMQELRARFGMEDKTPDQIAEAVQAAYAKGQLPKWRWWRSRTCSLRTRISGLELAIGILT